MTTTTEYRRIGFHPFQRLPGGPKAAYDTSSGGSIVRVTGDGRDDVIVTDPAGNKWALPWEGSVAWAVEGKAEDRSAAQRERIERRIASRRPPVATPQTFTDSMAINKSPKPAPELAPEPDSARVEQEERSLAEAGSDDAWSPPREPKPSRAKKAKAA